MTAHPEILASRLEGADANIRVVNADLAQTNARSASGELLAEVYIRPRGSWRSPMQLAKMLVGWFEAVEGAKCE